MDRNHAFETAHAMTVYSASRALWDTPLFESKSFVAVPTVGALVEGWLLIVPKRRLLAFARLSDNLFGELERFVADVSNELQAHYGAVSMFEHGPCTTGSSVGCGVDYAHLHLVPTACDLHLGAQRVAPSIRWSNITALEEIRHYASARNGYWLLQEPYGLGEILVGECDGLPPSQLFRRVIASYLNVPERFDWKTSLGEDRIIATVETLRGSPVAS